MYIFFYIIKIYEGHSHSQSYTVCVITIKYILFMCVCVCECICLYACMVIHTNLHVNFPYSRIYAQDKNIVQCNI